MPVNKHLKSTSLPLEVNIKLPSSRKLHPCPGGMTDVKVHEYVPTVEVLDKYKVHIVAARGMR